MIEVYLLFFLENSSIAIKVTGNKPIVKKKIMINSIAFLVLK